MFVELGMGSVRPMGGSTQWRLGREGRKLEQAGVVKSEVRAREGGAGTRGGGPSGGWAIVFARVGVTRDGRARSCVALLTSGMPEETGSKNGFRFLRTHRASG